MAERNENEKVDPIFETEFISGLSQGDPAVVSALYKKYYVSLCNFSYCFIRDAASSEDIVANVFLRLLTRQRKIKGVFHSLDDVANYLHIAVKNASFDFLRSSKSRIQHQQKAFQNTEQDDLDLMYERALTRKDLLETLYDLPQKSIKILTQLYLEELSYTEVAKINNISPTSVVSHRRRAMDILSKKVKREDFMDLLSFFLAFLLPYTSFLHNHFSNLIFFSFFLFFCTR